MLLLKIIIPDAKSGARFLRMDLKDIFLHTLIEQLEYMKVLITYFSDNIEENYHSETLEHHGYIYIKIKIGMYGLNQDLVLAYQQ